MLRIALGALLLAFATVGCAGSDDAAAPPPRAEPAAAKNDPFPDDPQILLRATSAAQRRALFALADDIRAMRKASAEVDGQTLKGTPAIRAATGRFIVDLERSGIDLLSQNRLIDHAAAAVSFACEQCFQQLEAMRPIPALAH